MYEIVNISNLALDTILNLSAIMFHHSRNGDIYADRVAFAAQNKRNVPRLAHSWKTARLRNVYFIPSFLRSASHLVLRLARSRKTLWDRRGMGSN